MKLFAKLFTVMAVIICTAFAADAQLPSVQLKNLAGKPVDTATLSNDGKPFIISFWATWCKPCRRELKAIHEVYEDWQEETGVKVIAVSIDKAQDVTKVKPIVDNSGWDYEILLDPNSDFLRSMGGSNVPFVVVVDGNGKVFEAHSGYTEGSEDHLLELVKEAAEKSK